MSVYIIFENETVLAKGTDLVDTAHRAMKKRVLVPPSRNGVRGPADGPKDPKRLLAMRKMRDAGATFGEIAEKFGVSQPSAFLYLKRWKEWRP